MSAERRPEKSQTVTNKLTRVCWCLRVTTLHVSLFLYGWTREIVTNCRRQRQYFYQGHFPSDSAVEATCHVSYSWFEFARR